MPKFQKLIERENPVNVTRKQVFWMADFRLPDDLKEGKAFTDYKDIEGYRLMGFYADPTIGDVIHWGGYLWEVIGRSIHAARYKSRDEKVIPSIHVKFISEGNGNVS